MEWWAIQELMITSAVIIGALVPVFALTYRFVLKPVWGNRKQLPGEPEAPLEALREARLDNMERQLEDLEVSVRRLVDVTEFDRQLKGGNSPE